MYCRKCGKQIENGTICQACVDAETLFQPIPAPVETKKQGSKTLGLSKAIVASAISFVAYCLILLALSAAAEISSIQEGTSATDPAYLEVLCACALFACVLSSLLTIPAVILGIQSVLTFSKQAKAGNIKPVATFVLGIVALALAGTSVFTSAQEFPAVFAIFASL